MSWFYESASDRAKSPEAESHSTFGAVSIGGMKTFDEHFEDLYNQYKESGIDIKRDFNAMMADKSFMESYKQDLMEPVIQGFQEMSENDPHIQATIKSVGDFWDNKVKSYSESAIAQFLPISTLEFPVLVKQFFSSILKDIIEIETVKSPNISKHVRTTYMVDNQTGDEYEYPKCLFDGTWEKIYDASRGYKIEEKVVPLTDGRLYKYDIISELTEGTAGIDTLSWNFKIIAIQVASQRYELPGNAITVEFSTNGTLVNGDLDFTAPDGTQIQDTISGQVDFKNGTISVSSASGQVTGLVFSGYLSNEKNLRTISVREKRDVQKFTIEDGPRWNMPFSIEDIEDAAAMLDINYYNRMVDEITRTQEMNECMTVIKFLNDEFAKFNGVSTDLYNLESLAMVATVDLNPPAYFAGDPFKYISTAIQFRLKALIHQISELTKMEDLSFVIVGNPMATQLISEFVQWKSTQGTSVGGISVNGAYGFATDMGANIRVVATNLYDAYTVKKTKTTEKRELVLHIYAYPTSPDHISFRHLKYSSHLMTSQSQTAYQSTAAPGGAFNIVTATARYKTISIQGIQAQLIMFNSEKVYGPAPKRPPIVGAPWTPAV